MDGAEVAFWPAIAAATDDDLPKLVFADWLDERSDCRGKCLRWVVLEHKKPAFDRIDTKTWDWWSRVPADPVHYDISPRAYVLPINLFTRLTPFGPGLWKGLPTFAESFRNLAAAWQECIGDGVDPLGDDRPRPEPAGIAVFTADDV